MPSSGENLYARQLWPYLLECGYLPANILQGVSIGNRDVSLAGFAQRPFDSRSSCVSAMDVVTTPEADAKASRSLGAPLTFLCQNDSLLWWSQTDKEPYQVGVPIPSSQVEGFFREHKSNFAPNVIYRAKTLGRFESGYQLSFVDLDLMPFVEKQAGEMIERLLLDSVAEVRDAMGWPKQVDLKQGQWLVKSVFWLLGAKMLHDKGVEGFIRLDFRDVDEVFARLSRHYGESADIITSEQKRRALEPVGTRIDFAADLRMATTEALAYVYENTLISDEIRTELGTHSTPSYLVDYVVGRLEPWIRETNQKDRRVFEPACGHAAFLVAAIRLLTSLLPPEMAEPKARKKYLRERVYGYDTDDFAVEIARLSLTLTDIPNPNGWSVKVADLFESDLLERMSTQSTILLSNTPFEDIKPSQRQRYATRFRSPRFLNKTAELLYRALSSMPVGGMCGVVVPQALLHERNASDFRKLLIQQFDIQELCLFPDNIFNFADQESAVVIGRKIRDSASRSAGLRYRRVREREMSRFRESYGVTSEVFVNQQRFEQAPRFDLRVPDLERVWQSCERLPKLRDYADIGQGFSHIGEDQPTFPTGTVTVSDTPFAGAVEGFQNLGTGIYSHQLPPLKWLNLSPDVVRRPMSGTLCGVPQVLLNEAPVQRAPWCLRAMIDRVGRPAKSSFTILRPRSSAVPLEIIWAILNSPIANAYAYSHSSKRNILTGTWREFPVPRFTPNHVDKIERAVKDYFELATQTGPQMPLLNREELPADKAVLRDLHWRIDAEVLRLYELPPALERDLLDYFTGWRRADVPFNQERYFPEGFDEPISLSDLIAITTDWDTTNSQRHELIAASFKQPLRDEEVIRLKELQRLAGLKRELLSSPSLKELVEIESDLRRRALWKGL
jgi:N-6 DNA methylase